VISATYAFDFIRVYLRSSVVSAWACRFGDFNQIVIRVAHIHRADRKARAGGEIEHTLTRSTSHPGWQLTHWMLDGSPYGHSDVFGNIADAFDTRATASGEPVTGLAQVVFRDGRVLVRSGFKKVEVNPRKGKAKFDEADLSHLLSPPGADPRIGLERGKAAKNGIALFINPWGSYRYVLYEDRCPIAAIQIVRHGDHGRHGIIAGVYTRPDRRAQGLATKLEARAKKDFDVISHSEHLTTAGAAFKRKLMGR